MKNHIWVSRSKMGVVLASFVKPKIDTDGSFKSISRDKYTHCDANIFGLDIAKGETVEVVYDTETGEVEVKKEREIGWYLTVNETSSNVTHAAARFWDGSVWKLQHSKKLSSDDEYIKVISEKLPDNEYLRSLE